jgi:hypothetical protein
MSSKKKFNPMGYAMENMKLSAGVAVGGMMTEGINNATGNHIDTGPSMKMLSTLPMIHATGGVLQELKEMGSPMKRQRHK